MGGSKLAWVPRASRKLQDRPIQLSSMLTPMCRACVQVPQKRRAMGVRVLTAIQLLGPCHTHGRYLEVLASALVADFEAI